jgi:hypothetical protein
MTMIQEEKKHWRDCCSNGTGERERNEQRSAIEVVPLFSDVGDVVSSSSPSRCADLLAPLGLIVIVMEKETTQ